MKTTTGALFPSCGPREPITPKREWTVYVLRFARNNNLYCGITLDLNRRLNEHCDGPPKGSKYVHSQGLFALVMKEMVLGKSNALKKEAAFKKLKKAKKEKIISEFAFNQGVIDASRENAEGRLWETVGGKNGKPPLNDVYFVPNATDDTEAYFDGYRSFVDTVVTKDETNV